MQTQWSADDLIDAHEFLDLMERAEQRRADKLKAEAEEHRRS